MKDKYPALCYIVFYLLIYVVVLSIYGIFQLWFVCNWDPSGCYFIEEKAISVLTLTSYILMPSVAIFGFFAWKEQHNKKVYSNFALELLKDYRNLFPEILDHFEYIEINKEAICCHIPAHIREGTFPFDVISFTEFKTKHINVIDNSISSLEKLIPKARELSHLTLKKQILTDVKSLINDFNDFKHHVYRLESTIQALEEAQSYPKKIADLKKAEENLLKESGKDAVILFRLENFYYYKKQTTPLPEALEGFNNQYNLFCNNLMTFSSNGRMREIMDNLSELIKA